MSSWWLSNTSIRVKLIITVIEDFEYKINKYFISLTTTTTTTIRWFRGEIDSVVAEYEFYPVDLTNERYFQHGGNLIISQPMSDDSGSYYCKATNVYGTVNSNIMQLREIVLDRFEKRERPNVIAQGYRESVINCLYNNKNTEEINYIWFF